MVNTRWLVFNRRILVTVVVILVLIFMLYRITGSLRARAFEDPATEFYTALENTMASQSFRFGVQVKMGNRLISDIEGRKAVPDAIHITGTMQNTPVEFIHVGGKAYIKGYWSDNWSVLPENSLVDSELFITELNPLGNFLFKDIPEIRYQDMEKIDGVTMNVLEMRPIVENPIMELNYDDFIYRVWVEPRDKLIRKAHITAFGKNGDRDRLEITIELWDYNRQINISPPDIY